MKESLRMFTNGLNLSGPVDQLPEGVTRKNRGISAFAKGSFLSRRGSSQLYALDAHSITYFASQWYTGVSTSVYRAAVEIITSLSGERLSFMRMPPVPGTVDYLFISGGGILVKTDEDGTDSNWGIEPPGNPPSLADSGSGGNLSTGTYKYQLTFKNSITGHRSNPIMVLGDNVVDLLLHLENNVTDSAGNHTPVNNGSASFSAVTYKFGAYSIILNGSSQYVSVPGHPDFVFRDDFTVHLWINPDSVASDSNLWAYYGDATHYISLDIMSGDLQFKAVIPGRSTVTISTSLTVSTGSWQHVALVGKRMGSATYIKIALDGTFKPFSHATDYIWGLWPDWTYYPGANVHFGYNATESGYFDGFMDELVSINGEALWWDEDFTPPASATALSNSVTLAGDNYVNVTNIDQPTDDQADVIELWRTVVNGSDYYKLAEVDDGQTSFTDDIADDDLGSEGLSYNNIKPYLWFDDCYGPFNAACFWITRTQEGERGRVYYSRTGYPESMESYIEVSSDDDGLQRIVGFNGNMYAVSKARWFQIYGENPYYSRKIEGAIGTSKPHTVVVTPYGIVYEADDGWRIFSGSSSSPLLSYEAVAPIARGESAGSFTSFTGVIAAFAREEYIVSDQSQTLALNLSNGKWRDVGVGFESLYYAKEAAILAGNLSNKLVEFEKAGTTQDNGSNISVALEAGHINFGQQVLIEAIYVDANSATETIAVTSYLDGSSQALGNLDTTTGRRFTRINVGKACQRFGLLLSGSIDAQIEIFGIEIIYTPVGEEG